jgi:uncharacterized protein (TIRG00374 family)
MHDVRHDEAPDTGRGDHAGHRLLPWSKGRILLLAFTALCLYVFAPSIAEVFSAYDRLGDVEPLWLIPAVACAIGSFACVWLVQALALGSTDWFSVITTQLAGNAFNRITPGGGATGTALQTTMLHDAGCDPAYAATALTAQSILSTAAIVALPVFALPFVIAGVAIPNDLLATLWLAIPVFLLMAALGLAMFASDRPLRIVGSLVTRLRNRPRRSRRARRSPQATQAAVEVDATPLDERLLHSRDLIRAQLSPRWQLAVGASVLRWLLEYAVLVLTLYGLGASPSPALVLLAFVAAALLGLLPFTPGGLGFVEAGLAGTLALAGISTGDALVATLVYRLLTFWMPIPTGLVAAFLFRRRHPRVNLPGRKNG